MLIKRIFAVILCLVFVFCSFCPFSVSAIKAYYELTNYFVSESDINGYTIRKYTINASDVSDPRYRKEYDPPAGTHINKEGSGLGVSEFFSNVRQKLQLYVSLFAGTPTGSESSGDGVLFTSAINHADYQGIDFYVTAVVKSTVDCTIQYGLILTEWDESFYYNFVKRNGPLTSISLEANKEYTLTAKANFATFPVDRSVAANTTFYVYAPTVPNSGEISVTAKSASFDVKLSALKPNPPIIETDLEGEFTYFRGDESLPFTVSASSDDGGALTYAWYYNTAKSYEGSTYCGNTDTCYPSTSSVGTFYYYCVVTSTRNNQSSSVSSNFLTINVVEPPKPPAITQDLSTTPVTYIQGEQAAPLVISATSPDSGELSYQWYGNNVPKNSGGWFLGGASDPSFVPSTSTLGTTYYYCVVTNTKGKNISKTTSKPACIEVIEALPSASTPSISNDLSRSQVVYEKGDAAAALRISASVNDGGVLSYQWYSNSVQNNYGGIAIPGATMSSYVPDTVSVGTTYYYCVVTNTLNGTAAAISSSPAWITVNDPPPVTTPPILDEIDDKLDGVNDKLDDVNQGLEDVNNQLGDVNQGLDDVQNELGNTNDKLDDTNDKLDGVNDQLGDTNEKLEESNGLLSDIIQGILDLPQAILDGIKGLFVPDTETMAAYKDRWDELLASRFGAIYESIAIIDEFASSLRVYDQMNVIEFPSVTVDLAGADWTFGGWVVDVVPEGFGFLVEILKKGVSVIATFAFLNAMRNKFEGILGGGKM